MALLNPELPLKPSLIQDKLRHAIQNEGNLMRCYQFILLCCLWLITSNAAAQNPLMQRMLFQEAHTALQNRDFTAYKAIEAQLSNYIIFPYLQYQYFKTQLNSDTPDNDRLHAFLQQQNTALFADELRQTWLYKLAKAKDWTTYLQVYTPQNATVLQCHQLHARLATQTQMDGLMADIEKLWVVGKSQPKACDPAFAYFAKQGGITPDLRWQRVWLLLKNGNLKLARYFAKSLSKIKQTEFNQWRNLLITPAKQLSQFRPSDTPEHRVILVQALRSLARKKVETALSFWQTLQKNYAFSEAAQAELNRYFALHSAWQKRPKALQRLMLVAQQQADEAALQLSLQLLLKKSDWQGILKFAQTLSTEVRNDLQWQYWQARALAETKQADKARALYIALAKQRDFYGFLAAEKLNQAYAFNPKTLRIDAKILAKLQQNPTYQRAQELFRVGGFSTFARQEWSIALEKATPDMYRAAAQDAYNLGWYDRAIIALARTKDFDVLEWRFPTPFYDMVTQQTTDHNLNFAWAYAIMRQESAFQIDARSKANALGLMQLLPTTAERVAKSAGVKLKTEADIMKPVNNILLGTTYLAQMRERLNNNHILATAAYNAGPGRAKRWAKEHACLPPDVFIELIPFKETRNYVKRVLSYTAIFEYRLLGHGDVRRMLLNPVKSNDCPT